MLEFIGGGVKTLTAEERIGVDVMTTETTCLSSVWETDEKIREYYKIHDREGAYKEMKAEDGAYYDFDSPAGGFTQAQIPSKRDDARGPESVRARSHNLYEN